MDDNWGDADDSQRGITEELPRVAVLPKHIRYRCFTGTTLGSHVRWTGADTDFFLNKRRRYEEVTDSSDVVTPLPRVLNDSFEIAARQLSTYYWLSQPHSAQEMCARFALDRRLGVRPSLSAINRAIRTLSHDGQVDAILDIMEDLIVEGDPLSLSTVLEIINSLQAQPARAMRVALLLQTKLRAGTAIPAAVWQRLSSDFARSSQGLPKPLDDHFMGLLESVMYMVRWESKYLSEELIVEFGKCLLDSRKPLDSAMKLVQEELLSGRNQSISGSCTLQLSAFLTDLLTALCSSSARAIYDVKGTPPDPAKLRNLLIFSGDVIKYAYAQKVQLAPKALDSVLLLCDACHDYHRLYILFLSMCVLSVPTLCALLRVVEVVNAIPGIASRLSTTLCYRPQDIFVWCLEHFESILAPTSCSMEDAALSSLCRALGTCLADSDADAAKMIGVFHILLKRSTNPQYSAVLLSSYLASRRQRYSAAASIKHIQLMESINHLATIVALSQGRSSNNVMQSKHYYDRTFLAASLRSSPIIREGSAISIDFVLASAISAAPQAHFNVLDASILNSLARDPRAEEAFVGMMNMYVSQGGTRTILPFEALSEHFGELSPEALALMGGWGVQHGAWFAVLPPSLSIQLQGNTCTGIACDLFHRLRRAGHQKVAFMCSDPHVAEAIRAKGIRPVILLEDLLQRLSKRAAQ
ncbi:unnamed protein product [Phytomonas sp. EM1]|nr:unnamed protein product [Phytomonas sp. EM1]|eukprot:CCW64288.1 unnamed protein product [Phytomonas sp. isolate EM1]